MNIFTMMLMLALLGSAVLGLACLIIAAVKRSWKIALWTIGATLSVWVACCGLMYLFFTALDNTLHRPVANAEVIGVWHLADSSVTIVMRDVPAAKKDSYLIELRPNGTCRYHSFQQFPMQVADAEGRWSIQPKYGTKDVTELRLDIAIDGKQLNFAVDFGESDGKLYLWEYWLDPDSGEILRYEKLAL